MLIYKFSFFLILISSIFISISSPSWTGMWIGLEINLLSMIPLMNKSNNRMASEASLKYFIIQAIASMILLSSMILMMKSMNPMNYENSWMNLTFNISLLLKTGAAPLHFWVPEIIEGISWMNCFIMLTIQKIAPLSILSYNLNIDKMISLFVISSLIIGGCMGLNQISIRKILTYSSINHLGWIISSMMTNKTIWILYILIYTLISLNLILYLKSSNKSYINQLKLNENKNSMKKFIVMINLFSLGGLPPFIGFLPKWLIIQSLSTNNFLMMILMMVIINMITLYFYLRTMINIMTLNSYSTKIIMKKNSNQNIWIFWNVLFNLSLILMTNLFYLN